MQLLEIHSGQEQENNSPLLGTQSLEEAQDPAQAGSMEHLWHGQGRATGSGQPGLKIETLLWEGRLGVIQAALGWS